MDVIEQKVYTIDGVAAGRAGEWPGLRPNHWTSSKKILKPIARVPKNYLDRKI